jgi:hypothetical protein
MQLDKLQIALRPRPAAQALDLGFALLRAHAAAVYKVWLALWLPAMALAGALAVLAPDWVYVWILLPWWVRPLLERGPLYVLSRQVFGEDVTWRQALRAWPGQLGGGWLRMLTWWRPFMPGRGLYQPIWQLEQVRGVAAAERRAAIGRNGTARAAYLFGLACAHFEAVLYFGLYAFVGLFLSDSPTVNPFSFLAQGRDNFLMTVAMPLAAIGISGAIIGPIYTACCFTLYLNRRATLEAWDIELVLRQIEAPAARRIPSAPTAARAQAGRALPALLAVAVLPALAAALMLILPAPAVRAGSGAAPAVQARQDDSCKRPKRLQDPSARHTPARGEEQAALHRELQTLYAGEDLRGYQCEHSWRLKDFGPSPKRSTPTMPDLSGLALAMKIALIAGALWLSAWLLYRYRGKFEWLLPRPAPLAVTEIAGLDIRAESLPGDVPGTVRSLWDQGELRAALALLYRATLSRLVQQDGLSLAQGATEGDCLRLATQAVQRQALTPARYGVASTATTLWLNGAYGNHWPDSASVHATCGAWQEQFGVDAGRTA